MPRIDGVTGLSMDVECEFSGLPQLTCAHCTGDKLEVQSLDDEYEVTLTFESRYSGSRCVNCERIIKKGSTIGRVQRIENPFLPVQGYACQDCVKTLPKVRK